MRSHQSALGLEAIATARELARNLKPQALTLAVRGLFSAADAWGDAFEQQRQRQSENQTWMNEQDGLLPIEDRQKPGGWYKSEKELKTLALHELLDRLRRASHLAEQWRDAFVEIVTVFSSHLRAGGHRCDLDGRSYPSACQAISFSLSHHLAVEEKLVGLAEDEAAALTSEGTGVRATFHESPDFRLLTLLDQSPMSLAEAGRQLGGSLGRWRNLGAQLKRGHKPKIEDAPDLGRYTVRLTADGRRVLRDERGRLAALLGQDWSVRTPRDPSTDLGSDE